MPRSCSTGWTTTRSRPNAASRTPDGGYRDSSSLIEKWHGRGRLHYAISPRFAITSSDAQLESAGRLATEHPGVFVHSHVAENLNEVKWARELFPQARSYLDVYDHFGLLRERAVYAHCILPAGRPTSSSCAWIPHRSSRAA